MIRRLFATASCASFIAAVAMAGLWARGGSCDDVVRVWWDPSPLPRTHCFLASGVYFAHRDRQGSVEFSRYGIALSTTDVKRPRWSHQAIKRDDPSSSSPPRAFRPLTVIRWPGSGSWKVVVPDVLITAVLGVLPAGWFLGLLRRRRAPAGHCLCCGYDLRATPERCPEMFSPV